MQTAILTLHVIVCLVLIVLVLLQSGREGMGVIFGGGGNSSVFGTSGAGGMLVKLTAFLAVLFIVTSLGYNILTSPSRDKTSDILDVQFETVIPAPAQTTPPSSEPVSSSAEPEPTTPSENVAPAPEAEATSPSPTEAPSADTPDAPAVESPALPDNTAETPAADDAPAAEAGAPSDPS